MNEAEWRRRFAARIVAAGADQEAADMSAEACDFDAFGYDLEESPEDAADDEMSYWEADE